MILAMVDPVRAGNELTTIVLHAHRIDIGPLNCEAWEGEFDCTFGHPPRVVISAGEAVAVFVFLRNQNEAAGLIYRFAVDGGSGSLPWGDWTNLYSSFGCQPTQFGLLTPNPTSGELVTSFNCLTGGALEPLGFIAFIAGTHGCLTIEESERYASGVADCTGRYTAVAPQNRGMMCIGSGGYGACDPQPVTVEARTWGQVKAHFR
jgi:hypothetical protein